MTHDRDFKWTIRCDGRLPVRVVPLAGGKDATLARW